MIRHFLKHLFIICLAWAVAHAEPTILKSGDVVAVCGDSLTEQKVYSVFVEDYLLMCQPVPGVKTLDCGWGGSTA